MKSRFFVALAVMIVLISCSRNDTDSTIEKELQIKAAIDSVVTNTHVPGIVAGIWAPDLNFGLLYSSGFSDLTTNAPMDAGMVFRIGSNTKTMTNTVLLRLVDEELVSLEDKLSVYLPDFPRAGEITIDMLCNMRSGIHNYSEDTVYQQMMVDDPGKVWQYDELISFATDENYDFPPGTDFHYSNTNTILIAIIVEQITGKTLKSLINEIIIEPLGLTSTKYYSDGVMLEGYHPTGYYSGSYDSLNPDFGEYYDVSWAGPAGGAASTAQELAQYVTALVDGTFLSDELQQRRLSELFACSRPGFDYGLGILKYNTYYGHTGSIPGFTSIMLYSPEKNCKIIIWFNCQLTDLTPYSSGLPDRIDEVLFK